MESGVDEAIVVGRVRVMSAVNDGKESGVGYAAAVGAGVSTVSKGDAAAQMEARCGEIECATKRDGTKREESSSGRPGKRRDEIGREDGCRDTRLVLARYGEIAETKRGELNDAELHRNVMNLTRGLRAGAGGEQAEFKGDDWHVALTERYHF